MNKFIAAKYKLEQDKVKVTTLMPRSINKEDVKFMQYRVSIPENIYATVKNQSNWPVGVRIRDFVFKRGNLQSSNASTAPVDRTNFMVSIDDGQHESAGVSSDANQNLCHNVIQDFHVTPTNVTIPLQNSEMDRMD